MRSIAFSSLLVVFLSACGGASNPCSSGSAACGQLRMQLTAINSGAARLASAPVEGGLAWQRSALTAPAWLAGSILSGPPDRLVVQVLSVTAIAAGADPVPLFQSSAASGTSVELSHGTADLAQALGAASLALPPGDYTALELTLGRVGTISGCVSGTFRATSAATGTLSSDLGGAASLHGGNVYANDPIVDGAPHTFCTRASRSELSAPTFSTSAIGSNAQFEGTAPEPTEIDLESGNQGGLGAEQLRAAQLTVRADLPFAVAKGEATRLTLAVDLDRMLRYFANTREDFNPPNPSMKAGTSYFFTTVFRDSLMLVAGDQANVQGYQLLVSSANALVPEWLTVIRNPNGEVAAGLVMPDDDNDLTVAKGRLDAGPPAASAGGGLSLGFSLGATERGSLEGFSFLPAVGDEGTCALDPLPNPAVSGATFTISVTRRL